jgi:hypothetical protein
MHSDRDTTSYAMAPMSLDYFDYNLVCLHCGNPGVLRYSRDQWNYSEVSCSGFEIIYADPRPEASALVCKQCQSTEVVVAQDKTRAGTGPKEPFSSLAHR